MLKAGVLVLGMEQGPRRKEYWGGGGSGPAFPWVAACLCPQPASFSSGSWSLTRCCPRPSCPVPTTGPASAQPYQRQPRQTARGRAPFLSRLQLAAPASLDLSPWLTKGEIASVTKWGQPFRPGPAGPSPGHTGRLSTGRYFGKNEEGVGWEGCQKSGPNNRRHS